MPPDSAMCEVSSGEPVIVVARLPNGSRSQTRVDVDPGDNDVVLFDGLMGVDARLAYATGIRDLSHLAKPATESQEPIKDVWALLWRYEDGQWVSSTLPLGSIQSFGEAKQIAFDLPQKLHLLQVGGRDVAWRLIALPPEPGVRVALTRSKEGAKDPLDVTVSRTRPIDESLMGFMASGAIPEAMHIAKVSQLVERVLDAKMSDPVSAAVGGYYLLRTERLGAKQSWGENLANLFPWFADGAIIMAAFELQRPKPNVAQALQWVQRANQRGLPVFALGLKILAETMQLLEKRANDPETFARALRTVKAYQAARSGGAYTSFYGVTPTAPSLVRVVGLAGAPVHDTASTAATEVDVRTRTMDLLAAREVRNSQYARVLSHSSDSTPSSGGELGAKRVLAPKIEAEFAPEGEEEEENVPLMWQARPVLAPMDAPLSSEKEQVLAPMNVTLFQGKVDEALAKSIPVDATHLF